MGPYLLIRGHWDEFMQLSERAYEATRAIREGRPSSHAFSVTFLCCKRGQSRNAVLWAQHSEEAKGLDKWRMSDDSYDWLEALVAIQLKDYAKAEQILHYLINYDDDEGWREDSISAFNALGEIVRARKDYDAAEGYYREALGITEQYKHKTDQMTCYGNLGKLALDRKQWAEAHKWFDQELALAQEIGDVELIAEAQNGLARVHETEGRADLAMPLAQEALKIYERLQHKDLAETRELVERLKAKQPPP